MLSKFARISRLTASTGRPSAILVLPIVDVEVFLELIFNASLRRLELRQCPVDGDFHIFPSCFISLFLLVVLIPYYIIEEDTPAMADGKGK